ncbi:hypothetical protein DPMN_076640 [Dreissena polymorpha]|uniref:Myb/SANT-like DNA-binding domain-containing protein n=1 Tax=Dreissena polymorpha TaxID=45954 RepID=A0A9D3YLX0_DREPO|nr:hypothetical protein DPMN_076640 [Dreissena polymorpha]
MKVYKQRNTSWSHHEKHVLVDAFCVNRDIIEGKLTNKFTKKGKIDFFQQITDSQSLTTRTAEQVKKKLSDLKTEVRKKRRERLRDPKVTGEGTTTIILTDWQEKLFSVLPKVTVEGFKGIDIFQTHDLDIAHRLGKDKD